MQSTRLYLAVFFLALFAGAHAKCLKCKCSTGYKATSKKSDGYICRGLPTSRGRCDWGYKAEWDTRGYECELNDAQVAGITVGCIVFLILLILLILAVCCCRRRTNQILAVVDNVV